MGGVDFVRLEDFNQACHRIRLLERAMNQKRGAVHYYLESGKLGTVVTRFQTVLTLVKTSGTDLVER